MNKNILIIAALVIVLALAIGFLAWRSRESAEAPAPGAPVSESNQSASVGDSTASIEQALDDVNLNDLEKEFESIDADLNNL